MSPKQSEKLGFIILFSSALLFNLLSFGNLYAIVLEPIEFHHWIETTFPGLYSDYRDLFNQCTSDTNKYLIMTSWSFFTGSLIGIPSALLMARNFEIELNNKQSFNGLHPWEALIIAHATSWFIAIGLVLPGSASTFFGRKMYCSGYFSFSLLGAGAAIATYIFILSIYVAIKKIPLFIDSSTKGDPQQ